MQKINLKPLSVNDAWQGRRFKTEAYKEFEFAFLLMLPKIKLPPSPYKFTLCFGFSSKASDIDNPIKMVLDCLQKKYLLNDKEIYHLEVTREQVKKGSEFVAFKIEQFIK